ncbi:exosortase C-terminal domain/associated protein EpsI [Phenylobacterium sp.]|uniref:exosortase C-terminal domain/associated protein EpsI n=1 Tax=Phenylobacterium sp. TaxID=1871053 RepID=UPI0037CB16C2
MIARRDLLLGALCFSGAIAGTALKPRHEVRLLTSGKLADVVPRAFGDWNSEDVGDPYAVNGEGTLSAKLYNELLVRQYVNVKTGASVTLLMAYGGRQSDELQLHRPEVCYPAFGFNLTRNEPTSLKISNSVSVPARRLAAEAEGRVESIIYWSRMGELLPQDGGQQRSARLNIAMQGIIPDGLLSRFSMTGNDPKKEWLAIERFVAELIGAVAPARRNALIGSERANALMRLEKTAKG